MAWWGATRPLRRDRPSTNKNSCKARPGQAGRSVDIMLTESRTSMCTCVTTTAVVLELENRASGLFCLITWYNIFNNFVCNFAVQLLILLIYIWGLAPVIMGHYYYYFALETIIIIIMAFPKIIIIIILLAKTHYYYYFWLKKHQIFAPAALYLPLLQI